MKKVATALARLPYLSPVPVRKKVFTQNDFLKVDIDHQAFYLSSLPGFHELSLKEIDFKVKKFLGLYEINLKNLDFSKRFFNTINSPHDDFLDSIQGEMLFHVESILFGLIKKDAETPMVNTLYTKAKSLEENAKSPCIKIKIRPTEESLLSTLLILSSIHKDNPSCSFRLDGNRCFELRELLEFTSSLDKKLEREALLKIDYLEEPLKNFYETRAFHSFSPIPIALDESFLNFLSHPSSLEHLPKAWPVVIKPSFIGISPVYKWLSDPSRSKRRAILSSSFEHPSIMPALFFLAKTADSQGFKEFHGLENHFALNQD